jgi:hypothetical protein
MITPVLASIGGRRQPSASNDIMPASVDAIYDVVLRLTDVIDDVIM